MSDAYQMYRKSITCYQRDVSDPVPAYEGYECCLALAHASTCMGNPTSSQLSLMNI